MPDEVLIREYERARAEHQRAVSALVPFLMRMALDRVADVMPRVHELEVLGELNEDWVPILRIRRVLDAAGRVLFDVDMGHDDRTVEDVIDEVNIEFLDPLLELTGDDFMGAKTIDRPMAAS